MAAACAVPGPALSQAQPAADDTNPLHLRRVGLGNVEGMKLNIGVSIEACRVAKKLPLDAPKEMPSDEMLAKLVVIEDEEYFQGGRWAQYSTHRSVLADPSSADCRLALFISRGVTIEQTCESRYSVGVPSPQKMADPQKPEPPVATVTTGPGDSCRRKRQRMSVQGLPLQNAGDGTACVWAADALAASMRAAGLKAKGHDDQKQDFCLYARQPEYLWRGHIRQVVLKSSSSDRSLAGKDVSDLFGDVRGFSNQRLLSMTDGQPIPAERFSPSAAQAFVQQPAKSPLKP
ncbi:hypothetical protein [Ideonella sp.]|uniref:hypothetical protein n=1 Tax=Ideonella sp. TaxID=1929293 RepID=UPI0035B1ECF5